MELTVQDIAKKVGGTLVGSGAAVIKGVAGLNEATASDISYLKDIKSATAIKSAESTKAGAVIAPKDFNQAGLNLIHVDNPQAAFSAVLALVAAEQISYNTGVHPMASVSKSTKIKKDIFINPFSIIKNKTKIADKAKLVAQVYVGARTKIGEATILYPQTVIHENIRVDARCIIHGGTVIGSDGYGYYFSGGRHNKIPQIGTVIIEDDVEIGSGTAIDRATTGSTVIGKGTKIDNLVHIAHNVKIGAHSLILGQVGIAGSTQLGQGVVLAGQVGVADHVSIGDGVQVGAQSGVKGDIPAGAVLFGSPAQPIQDTMRQTLLIRRLPELFKDVKKLKDEKSK
jgi:UDP-3-O-[3-hydroxymyristoyl] glucosamine N-acyltransferase